MFCNNCGKKLDADSVFCTGCGKLAEPAEAAPPPVVQKDMDLSEDDIKIIQAYKTQGDSSRRVFEKEYPHINFKDYVAPTVQQGGTEAASDSQGGNAWIDILTIAAWISFIVTIIGGIHAGTTLAELTGQDFDFVGFLVLAASGLLILCIIMVFLTIAKDISRTAKNSDRTAKDTAEIKEILKNK